MKNKVFNDIKTIINTPNLCGEGCSNVGSSMVFFNSEELTEVYNERIL